jgi:hypothetical protein
MRRKVRRLLTQPKGLFVSPTGNDSNIGTRDHPFLTIDKAVSTVQPGGTVFIRGGTYNERIALDTSGVPGAWITFRNYYPGEVPIIDGTGLEWGGVDYHWDCLFDLTEKSYINVIGLRVINSKWAGIGSEEMEGSGCQHIIIQKCSTYNTKSSGIAFFAGADITVDGNSIEQACAGTVATQECISLFGINGFVISNNHVFNCTNDIEANGGEGIDAKEGCSNGYIHGNLVNDVVKVGIYLDSGSSYQSDIEVYGNTVHDSNQGIAIACESGGTLENVSIHHNLAYDIVNWSIIIGGWSEGYTHAMDNLSFDHNTVLNAGDGSMHISNADATNVSITNNTWDAVNGFPMFSDGWVVGEFTISGNSPNNTVQT